MSDFEPGVDLVVVNYRTPSDLKRFLDAYKHVQDTVPSSLVIVDVQPIADVDLSGFRDVTYLTSDENIGYARSCNLGAFQGNREVIALFNADTELFDDTLEKCYTALMDNPEWGVLGPMQVNRSGAITHAGVDGTPENPRPRGWRSRALEKYRDVVESVTVFGSAYFVKRQVWDELTYCPIFREEYPHVNGAFLPTQHYYEETWCSYHARWHGWKVIYYGEAIMIHEWHQASPVHGEMDKKVMPESRRQFRAMCKLHGIGCD